MTCIYFMKSRSKVFTHFRAFCAEIKTQFNASMRILIRDSAREYMLEFFWFYMDNTVFSISLHVLINPLKMELLRGRIYIYLKHLGPSYSKRRCLIIFGSM